MPPDIYANSPEEWFQLVEQHERAAKALAEDKKAAAQAYHHCGFAVECALKAYIMKHERLNAWPSRDARPDLYIHDVRQLAQIAGLVIAARDPMAASWATVFQWDRGQGYDPSPMPRKVARSMVEATFGNLGVVRWIRRTLA